MHTIENCINFLENEKKNNNPFGENSTHQRDATFSTAIKLNFCDEEKTIGILNEVFLHTLFQCTGHAHTPQHIKTT